MKYRRQKVISIEKQKGTYQYYRENNRETKFVQLVMLNGTYIEFLFLSGTGQQQHNLIVFKNLPILYIS